MIRPTILIFLASYALLSYVDGTSNLPHVPGNVQPFAENSKDAPAKKILRADETKENEERFNLIVKVREMRQDRVLKRILPQVPGKGLDATFYSLNNKKMSSALRRFKGEEDKLLKALSKSYGGDGKFITGLLIYERVTGRPAKNAKSLLEMLKQSWKKNGVDSAEALEKLELTGEPTASVLFDHRMTFLEDYMKLIVPSDAVEDTFFKTLEKGFGGRDKFFKLVAETIDGHGKESLIIGGRYANFLSRSKELEKGNVLTKTLEKYTLGTQV